MLTRFSHFFSTTAAQTQYVKRVQELEDQLNHELPWGEGFAIRPTNRMGQKGRILNIFHLVNGHTQQYEAEVAHKKCEEGPVLALAVHELTGKSDVFAHTGFVMLVHPREAEANVARMRQQLFSNLRISLRLATLTHQLGDSLRRMDRQATRPQWHPPRRAYS